MQFRRLGLVLVALLIVLASLAGCVAAGDMSWPDREITTDVDTALVAQDMAMAGLMTGSATWSEAEFSSLLTYLTKQNVGGALPLDEIKVWFEPGNEVFIELTPTADGMLTAPVRLVGTLEIVDNMVQVNISEAGVGGAAVMGPLLEVVNAAVNRALGDPSLGVAVDVATDTGTVTVGIGS